MVIAEKIESYYSKDQKFREGIARLREIALKTQLVETYKWGSPVYTIDNKNVLGILAFKSYFGLWFFNGVFLSDPKRVLENAQEGKTKSMRHWKFKAVSDIDEAGVLEYIKEAIANQKKGLELKPSRKTEIIIPKLLLDSLIENTRLNEQFNELTPYKQRDYCEYIAEAKQQKTKESRLEKILPMISKGQGLNDKYK
ncbi:DUF1801 domain-containing protein [uncultured Eudoraea sp.]|uniref:YdeI/OmpD-associated family protein n=1 Tax=uncultured Eudoraea sp. TaxID=1035614 RepID=UPI00262CDCC5|nr:DUF1801 domain-containing protein [uncultured Eudoraea sp.]